MLKKALLTIVFTSAALGSSLAHASYNSEIQCRSLDSSKVVTIEEYAAKEDGYGYFMRLQFDEKSTPVDATDLEESAETFARYFAGAHEKTQMSVSLPDSSLEMEIGQKVDGFIVVDGKGERANCELIDKSSSASLN